MVAEMPDLFMRTPKEKKIEKPWKRDRVIAGLQEIMRGMPLKDKYDYGVWLKYFETWGKITGQLSAPRSDDTTRRNIFVMPHEDNRDVWEQKLEQEQSESHRRAASNLATNTGLTSVSR